MMTGVGSDVCVCVEGGGGGVTNYVKLNCNPGRLTLSSVISSSLSGVLAADHQVFKGSCCNKKPAP